MARVLGKTQNAQDEVSWARPLAEGLRELGLERIYYRFDGGMDEGFAWADHAVLRGQKLAVEALYARLVEEGAVEKLRAIPQLTAGADMPAAKLYGGAPDDYLAIHNWFDESKAHMPDIRHRALRHHGEGIFLCEKIFGPTLQNSDGKTIPVRFIGEQHVKDDLGWIPSLKDWVQHLELQPWMGRTPFQPHRRGDDAPGETSMEGQEAKPV